MNNINKEKFDKAQVKSMRDDINNALFELEEKYNVKLKVGTINFDSDTVEAKISFAKMSENQNGKFAMTKEAKEFIQRAKNFGLSDKLLGEELHHKGNTYVITGYNTRASKNPIQFTVNGERYKVSIAYIKEIIQATRPEYFL